MKRLLPLALLALLLLTGCDTPLVEGARATASQRNQAAALLRDWQHAPCRWAEVFARANNL
jgi:hypothetical protein